MSPDGRSLAYLARADGGTFQLRVVPASGEGTSRLVHEAAAGERLDSPVAWAADGGSLFYVHHSATAGRELRSVSVAGGSGAVQTYGRGWCCVGHDLNVHPDGKRLVFLSGTNRTSVVVLSGF